MALGQWLAIGTAGAVCFSVLVGLVIARILGFIATEISELDIAEEWASAGLFRALPRRSAAPDDASVADSRLPLTASRRARR